MLRAVVLCVLFLSLVPRASVAGPAPGDGSAESCSDDVVRGVCVQVDVSALVDCTLHNVTASCGWTGQWAAAFRSEAGLPGEGDAFPYSTFSVCYPGGVCAAITADYYDACAWTSVEGCSVAHDVDHPPMTYDLAIGECLDAELSFGIVGRAAVPTLALPLNPVQADAAVETGGADAVCRTS